ncbi:MAG TPA: hypothetical protein VGQ23_16740, partial [Burkholderiaceae bacterium]|nr:hypothetical protein [Burkholderiaceae bacterium]
HLPVPFFKHSQSAGPLERLKAAQLARGVNLDSVHVNRHGKTIFARRADHIVHRTRENFLGESESLSYSASIEKKREEFVNEAKAHFAA